MLARDFIADARFYHRLKHAGADQNAAPLAGTILTSPGLWMLALHRVAYYCTVQRSRRNPLWWFARLVKTCGVYLNAVLGKTQLANDCEIFSPIYLSDKGYCILGAKSVGAGSIIHHRVTSGMAVTTGELDRPSIGEKVWIGPGCVIAGNLHIGDGSTLLPETYLTVSVPPRSVVGGNPAKVIRRDFDNATLRETLDVVSDISQL